MIAICPLCGESHTVVGPYKYERTVAKGDIVLVEGTVPFTEQLDEKFVRRHNDSISDKGVKQFYGRLMYCHNKGTYVSVNATYVTGKVDDLSDTKIDLD